MSISEKMSISKVSGASEATLIAVAPLQRQCQRGIENQIAKEVWKEGEIVRMGFPGLRVCRTWSTYLV